MGGCKGGFPTEHFGNDREKEMEVMRKEVSVKMKEIHRLGIVALVVFGFLRAYSQESELFIPKAILQAYQKQTRSYDGRPGINYWQNTANYRIKAQIFPSKRLVKGEETITYFNNSPDTLGEIVLQIFQDIYKKGSARDVYVSPDDVYDGVNIFLLKIVSSRQKITKTRRTGTHLIVELKNSFLPGDSIKIHVRWKFQIPVFTNLRMGGKDKSTYFIGQWYPEVAVYDDIYGWDLLNHTGGQEFYHNIGNYDVYINVPQGYLVWGTGVLQNPEEVLTKPFLTRYKKAFQSNEVIHIVKPHDLETAIKISKTSLWHYCATKVPDFCFAVSNHFLWDASSMVVDSLENRRVLVQAVYPISAEDFKEVDQLARKAIYYLSNDLPGVPFPYPSMTVFNGTNGTSGMEYPMVVNNPSSKRRGRTVDVTAHEITHSYFPFYVLTNETRYAWMDEAFASMIPYKLQKKLEPSLNRLTRYARTISQWANTERNLPTMSLATQMKGRIYYFASYTKPALALYYLKEMLGDRLFRRTLRAYIETWKHKHPTPYDFFFLMNRVTGRNLNWFWESWFFNSGYPDLAISGVKKSGIIYKVFIRKKGKLPVPVRLEIVYQDGSKYKVEKTIDVWKNGLDYLTIPIKTNKKIKMIRLGDDYVPDVNPLDNVMNLR